jgi:hypothetical protein
VGRGELLRHAAPKDPDVVTVADVPGDEPELLEVSVLDLDVLGGGWVSVPITTMSPGNPAARNSSIARRPASEAPTTATASMVRP